MRRVVFGLLGLAFGAGLGVGMGATMKDSVSTPSTQDAEIIVVFGYRGGLCEDGLCESSFSLYSDGRRDDAEPLTLTATDEVAALVADLDDEVLANLEPYSQDCGASVADGQDFYVLLPASGAYLEDCHELSPAGEAQWERVEALLTGG